MRIPKEFLKKVQRIHNKFTTNSRITQKISKEFKKKSQDFENMQFPTSHLEAENPLGLCSKDFLENSVLRYS